jgi:mRNA turnover protein 4
VKQDRRALKRDLASHVQECVDKYDACYVFSFENMRTSKFKEVRGQWADSRFLMGKNRVMQIALAGPRGDAEYRPGLAAVAGELTGNVGLLFTSRPHADVCRFFDEYAESDYARAGFEATETVVIPAGRMTDMPHTMADTLRKLGMPVRLDKGVVVNEADYTVCTEGAAITPEQGRLLKLFGKPLAVFKLTLLSWWHDGKYAGLAMRNFGAQFGSNKKKSRAGKTPSTRQRAAGGAGAGADGSDAEDGGMDLDDDGDEDGDGDDGDDGGMDEDDGE